MSPDIATDRPTLGAMSLNPAQAATSVVTIPVAAMKAHPVVWLVFMLIVAAVVIRYRDTILAFFAKAPGGDRVVAFTR